jgi:hypothetical protein
MKRILVVTVCVALPLALTGCDVLNYIWQHIVGHSYSQVDLATLESNSSNMSVANIGQSSMPVNSVLGYKTRDGFYGKMKVSTVSSSSLTFQFYTYDANGGQLAQSASVSVTSSNYCDLETGNDGPLGPAASDFQWQSGTLYPQGVAVFYVFP